MWLFYSAIQRALDLKRTCKHCKNSQAVKLHDRGKTVKCKRCGKDILPPKEHERG